MLGAATVLGEATGHKQYTRDAARFANRILEAESTSGGVLFDTCEQHCGCCDCQSFKGVAIRELSRWLESHLSSSVPTVVARARQVVNASARAVWDAARVDEGQNVFFRASWSAHNLKTVPCSLDAASHTSAAFALLAAATIL